MPSLKIELIVDDKGNIAITKTKQNLEGLNSETAKLGTTFTASFVKVQASALAASAAIAAISYGVVRLGKQFIDAALAMERINASVKASAGSATAAARELQYLREESLRLGLSFQDTALSYSKFMAATRGTAVEGERARRIFSQMSEGITALRLSSDEANGIFYAMSQMFSKGKVQAEELRGQLGERLPGAFNLAAKAMGITTAELDKMLQDGKVMASDLLPKLAEEIHKTYGQAAADAAKQGQAEINRFNNALFETKALLGKELQPVLMEIMKFIGDSIPVVKGFVYYFQALSISLAAVIDKGITMGKYYKTLHGIALGAAFNTDNFQAMKKELAEIDTVAIDRISKLDKQFYGKGASSQRSSAEIAAETARNAARAATEAAAAKKNQIDKAAEEAAKEAKKLAELQEQMMSEGLQKEQDLQFKRVEAYLSSVQAIYNIERQNQINLDKLRVSWGQKTHEEVLAAERDFQNEQLSQAKVAAERQLAYMSEQAGSSTPDQAQKGLELYNQIQTLTAQMAANRAYFDAQIYDATYTRLQQEIDFYAQIGGMEDRLLEKRLAAIERERKANVLLYRDEVSANKLAAQQIGEAYQKAFAKKAAAVATMFEGYKELFAGISKLYKDGSKDAQNWQDAAKAMEIAQRAVAVVTAVAAIANQGMGDPYTAFVRIGMMAATMGALLASIGESINGGGHGGSSSESYKPTTVLGGASGEASKSIQNALELLNDVNGESYVELVGIHRNMKELNNNITGLVRNLIQSGGNMKTFANLSSKGLGENNTLATIFEEIGALGSSKLIDLARQIPYIGALITAPFDLMRSVLGGIGNFISSSSIAHQSSGVKMLGTTIGDILDGVIVEGLYYTSVQIKKKSFGRVSRSNRTYYQAMDDATENMFNLVYRGIAESLYDIGTLLGQDTSKILSYAFGAQQIRLSGGSDQINQTIQDWMNALADTAAADLFGAFLMPFQKLGEGLYETAIRLVTDQAVIKSALEATGQAFRGTGEQLIYFSESLIDMAGDLDTLQGYFDTYADAFLREEEKITLIRKQLVGVLGYENLILPQTRNAYRDLVASLDLTTESGKTAYYTLMALSDAADSYYDYLEKQAENIVDTLSGYVDQLKSAKDRLLGDKDDQLNFATGMQQLRDVLNQVRGGSYNGLAGIDSALSAVTSLSMDRYGSYLDYQRDYYKALGVISELESLTSGRLTEWQAIQDTLQTNHDEDIDVAMAQLQALIGIHTAVGAQGSIGVPGYATGGIASGPESGYLAELHGTELIVSPKGSYSAKVNLDLSLIVEKLDRLIERVEAGDSVKASSLRQIERAITGITEDAFDADDRPALRVAT